MFDSFVRGNSEVFGSKLLFWMQLNGEPYTMIRMIQSMNSGHAKSYFNDALSRGDYYMDDQELGGQFHGKVAQRLNLVGAIEKKDFYKLCDNINPVTNDKLTIRNKSNRTVGYDINFHCPKSVSILHGLGTDKRVLEAFRDSVHSTMLLIEKDMKTRVRIKNKSSDRTTGEMIWGEFIHQTARPVDGSPPDPHLHAHCYALNVTWDDSEEKFKAGQFRDVKRDMPYYQSMFHKTLASNLEAIGYETRPTEKAFEVNVIPEKAIEVFSKRTDVIGRFIEENNIDNPTELDQIGARTRSKKEKGYAMSELRNLWIEQVKHIKQELDTHGEPTVQPEINHFPIVDNSINPKHCVDYALEHCFERNSVVQDRKILSSAIRFGLRNKNITIDEIQKAFDEDKRLIKIQRENFVQCTTHEVYSEEKKMIELARKGKGKFIPLVRNAHQREFDNLNKQQSDAVRYVLGNTDQITIIKGGAGTGKTTLMTEAVKAIESANRQVFTFAPTSQSRSVLLDEGFDNAQTVSRLLVDTSLQEKLQGQVMWVDEAGMISTKDMQALLTIAHERHARVVLSGDTKQHSSVERGDSLRILRQSGGVKTAGISQIYRQRREDYKHAVSLISRGKIMSGFDALEKMGVILEKDPMVINDTLVKDYMQSVDNNRTAQIITPTHAQAETITTRIRHGLKERNILKGKEYQVIRLKNKNLTLAQKRDPDNYTKGDVVQFSQNLDGISRGEKCEVILKSNKAITIRKANGKERVLPLDRAKDFEVYEPNVMDLTAGDSIRVTRNSQIGNTRLDNGTSLTVQGFTRNGEIKVKRSPTGNEIILPKDFGNINYAYVLTSYAAQGKTVDNVYIVQPSATFPATNMKQFYVSVSRGRDSVCIYTDSKEELLEHVQITGDRLSAIELHDDAIEASHDIAQQKEQDKNLNKNINKTMDNTIIPERDEQEPEI
ncbi:MAG TPA: MobF family relaxase [Draconibacterium sp.]|nr:MobF family relaxase [Draconibacterium sp.]